MWPQPLVYNLCGLTAPDCAIFWISCRRPGAIMVVPRCLNVAIYTEHPAMSRRLWLSLSLWRAHRCKWRTAARFSPILVAEICGERFRRSRYRRFCKRTTHVSAVFYQHYWQHKLSYLLCPYCCYPVLSSLRRVLCLSYCPLARFGVVHERALEFVVSRNDTFSRELSYLYLTLSSHNAVLWAKRNHNNATWGPPLYLQTTRHAPLPPVRPNSPSFRRHHPSRESNLPCAHVLTGAKTSEKRHNSIIWGLCLYLQTTRYVLMPTVCPNSHALRRYHPFCKNDLPLTCCFAPMHAREQKFRNKGIMVSYEDSISICTLRGTF